MKLISMVSLVLAVLVFAAACTTAQTDHRGQPDHRGLAWTAGVSRTARG